MGASVATGVCSNIRPSARRSLAAAGLALLFLAARCWGVEAAPARLNPAQLTGLVNVIQAKGTRIPIPAPLRTALGLTPAQVEPRVLQATRQSFDGARHGFALFNDHSGYLLFNRDRAGGLTVYAVGNGFELRAAVRDFDHGRFVGLAPEDARTGLDQEVGAWAELLSSPPPGAAGAAGAAAGPRPPAAKPSSPAKQVVPGVAPDPAK